MCMGPPGPPPMREDPDTGELTDQPWGRGLVSILSVVMLVAIVNDTVAHHWRAVGIEVGVVAVVVGVTLLVRRRVRRRRVLRRQRSGAADTGRP